MLHRSFKPAKCKTSLKMATSRIKVLKNKKEAQLKQLKREVAQLLESRQDQNARIRVEHVVREEKMKAAYDLIEIYCELIAARLPIVESQKNCPIDLKEAITSVVFASPRCADIPELLEVRKHFTAKYGKEFISAAAELRPDCGVNRMLVEKLSAMAPDGQTKLKILSAIAEEHNIEWDPNSFGEKDSKLPDDLLNGPNTLQNTSKMHAEPSIIPAPTDEVPNVPKHNPSVNLFQQNSGSTLGSQNFSSADIAGTKTAIPTTFEVRPSGSGAEFMEDRQPFSSDGNTYSLGRKNWNMEFKDATSAAQAAAESAERASMAARAAAELSSLGKITRRYSAESQKSNAYGRREEKLEKYATSKMPGEHLATNSGNYFFYDRNPKLENEQKDGNEHDNLVGVAERFSRDDHGGPKRSSRSASLKSNKESIDDDTMVNSLQKEDRYSRKSSLDEEAVKSGDACFSKMSMEKQSSESEVEFVSGQQHGSKSDNFNYLGKERIRKQSSNASSHSHSISFSGDYNVLSSDSQKFGNGDGEDPFVGIDQGNIHSDRYSRKSSYKEDEVVKSEDAFSAEMSMKKLSGEFKVEFVSGQQDDSEFENLNYFAEERISKQYSNASFHSHSSSFGDSNVSSSNNQKFGNDDTEIIFVGVDQGNIHSDTIQTSSHDNAATVFDESGSDDDGYKFDIGPKYDEQGPNLFFPSPGRKLPNDLDSWSPRQNASVSLEKSTSESHFPTARHSSPVISESLTKTAGPSKHNNILSVISDDSDPNSESEDEKNKLRHGKTMDSSSLTGKKYAYSKDPEAQSESHGLTGSSLVEKVNLGSDRMSWLHSSDGLDSFSIHLKNNQETEFNSDFQRKFSSGELPASQPSPMLGKSQLELNDVGSKSFFYSPVDEENRQQSLKSSRLSTVHEVKGNVHAALSPNKLTDDEFENQASPKDGKELNFGTLTGGLRNKSYIRPPYTKTTSVDASSSFKKAAEDRSTAFPTVESAITSGASMKVNDKLSSRAPIKHYYSDSDDSEEELAQLTVSGKGEPYNQKAGKEVNVESGSRAPVSYFDSEEDLPKQSSTSRGRSGIGFSRRTKASSSSETNSYSKVRVGYEASVSSDSGVERKPSMSSYGTETTPKPISQTLGSGKWRSSEQSSSMKLNSDSGVEREPSRSSYGTETEPMPQTVRSGKRGSSEKSSTKKNSDSGVEREPSGSSYGSETEHKPQTVRSGKRGSSERSSTMKLNSDSGVEREPPRRSYGAETEPKPQTVISGKWGSSDKSSTMKLNSDSGVEREPSRSSYGTETEPKHRPQTVKSGKWGISEQSNSMKLPDSKPIPESKFSMPKESSKSSVTVRPSNPLEKMVTSGSTENPKTSTPSGAPSRENSGKKASHVHPKLPDYDTIAAHLQSLRTNHQ